MADSRPEQAFYADSVLYARALRRRVLFWRLAAVILFITVLVVSSAVSSTGWRGEHIARVSIEGIIVSDQALLDRLHAIGQDEEVKALIVSINSPGGTGAASEALYASIHAIAEKKPVVAVMAELAASGGYVAALGADHILARSTTITGSIGMIFQWTEAGDLLESVGVDFPAIRSGPYKARPSFNEKASPEVVAVAEALVADGFNWFVELVAKSRGFEREEALKLADGRVYSGRQALALQLVDGLGGEAEALSWLEGKDPSLRGLPVIEHEEDEYVLAQLGQLSALVGQLLNAAPRAPQAGLSALWQPGR